MPDFVARFSILSSYPMTKRKPRLSVLLILLISCTYSPENKPTADGSHAEEVVHEKFSVVPNQSEQKVDVLLDGQLFTSYIYPSTIKKPVLWPVVTAGGNEITRQFPLKTKAGERVDHPHHVGIWLNYGDVNDLDFWNYSDAIPAEKAPQYGTIVHQSVEKVESGEEGVLITTSDWNDHEGNTLLSEVTTFVFRAKGTTRIIDRETTLTAGGKDVTFTDTKEGMFAIRVTSELELPRTGKTRLLDAEGNVSEVETPDNSTITGNYYSSEGLTGSDVWGTRARYVQLSGRMNEEEISIVIFDHPDNVGYPTYWHARPYGLFSANTLGQKAYSKGENELNFSLATGESTTFRYRLAVISGPTNEDVLISLANEFNTQQMAVTN